MLRLLVFALLAAALLAAAQEGPENPSPVRTAVAQKQAEAVMEELDYDLALQAEFLQAYASRDPDFKYSPRPQLPLPREGEDDEEEEDEALERRLKAYRGAPAATSQWLALKPGFTVDQTRYLLTPPPYSLSHTVVAATNHAPLAAPADPLQGTLCRRLEKLGLDREALQAAAGVLAEPAVALRDFTVADSGSGQVVLEFLVLRSPGQAPVYPEVLARAGNCAPFRLDSANQVLDCDCCNSLPVAEGCQTYRFVLDFPESIPQERNQGRFADSAFTNDCYRLAREALQFQVLLFASPRERFLFHYYDGRSLLGDYFPPEIDSIYPPRIYRQLGIPEITDRQYEVASLTCVVRCLQRLRLTQRQLLEQRRRRAAAGE